MNLLNKHILTFDLETSGLNLNFDLPWEIAWSIHHGYKLIENRQYFLKWPGGLKVSDGAARVTNYNPFKIEQEGKEPKEIIDIFCKFLFNKEHIIVGANILGYDCMILNSARKLLGYSTDYSYLERCYDTVALAKAYKQNTQFKKEDNFLAWQYRLLNTKVKGLKTSNSTMYKELTGNEIDHTKLHSGIYDIGLTTTVFFELMKKTEIQ
ncbi:MAG: hypothetical protein Q7R95_05970 [bacterium]|nr:hypothetical protein [bacterium]